MPSKNGYEQLLHDEGFTPKATHLRKQGGGREKVKTIGHGYNLSAATNPKQDLIHAGVEEDAVEEVLAGKREITREQAKRLFDVSVKRATNDAATVIPNFDRLDPQVQDVLINMSYQLGREGLRGFSNLRGALLEQDYEKAAAEIMSSHAAKKNSTSRYKRLSKQLLEYSKKNPKPVAPKVTAKEVFEGKQREALAEELSKYYQRESMVDELAKAVSTMNKQITDKNTPETE